MHENVFPGGMPVEGKQGNYIALAATLAALGALLLCSQAALESARAGLGPVSYTHLTLPTICSV